MLTSAIVKARASAQPDVVAAAFVVGIGLGTPFYQFLIGSRKVEQELSSLPQQGATEPVFGVFRAPVRYYRHLNP